METTKKTTEIENQEVKTEETTEIVECAEVLPKKPYEFRKLSSTDIFLMLTIISKIGVNEFMACLEGASFKKLVKAFTAKEEAADDLYIMGAVAGVLEIANVIFGNIHKCEKEIYRLLAQTSNLSIKEITAEGNAVMFFEMVIDFLKKDEFPDFIKAVSRLLK
jgi:hypothetical protein